MTALVSIVRWLVWQLTPRQRTGTEIPSVYIAVVLYGRKDRP